MINPFINIILCLILFPINKLNETQEMSDKMVSDYPFELNYCHDKYKIQEICNKSVDDFIPALKFVLD